jgi:hypothetical protein
MQEADMQKAKFKQFVAGVAMVAMPMLAAAEEHPVVKRPVDLPPSADLAYKIRAQQKGISLLGEAQLSWRVNDGSYSVSNVSRAQLLGKILENRSEGAIDAYGLAPLQFTEKRFRKEQTIATFDRNDKVLSFSGDKQTYTLQGGEQDRGSVQWQLAAVARAAPEKMTVGSEWTFFVAGRRDAEAWVFKVVRREPLKTGLGTVQTVHFIKAQPADSKEQRLDLWLAPALEWYPVKLRFSDDAGEFVEQTLEKITKK